MLVSDWGKKRGVEHSRKQEVADGSVKALIPHSERISAAIQSPRSRGKVSCVSLVVVPKHSSFAMVDGNCNLVIQFLRQQGAIENET